MSKTYPLLRKKPFVILFQLVKIRSSEIRGNFFHQSDSIVARFLIKKEALNFQDRVEIYHRMIGSQHLENMKYCKNLKFHFEKTIFFFYNKIVVFYYKVR